MYHNNWGGTFLPHIGKISQPHCATTRKPTVSQWQYQMSREALVN